VWLDFHRLFQDMVKSFQVDFCNMKAHLSTDGHDESDSRLVEFIEGDVSRSMR